MKTAVDTMGESPHRDASRVARVAGILAGATAFAAAFIVFSSVPTMNSPDAARELTNFYADGSRRLPVLLAEPLALIATAALVFFTGHLAARLRRGGDARRASIVMTGGGVLAALFLVAMVAHTVLAGTLAFAKGFTFDADLAMVMSHFGYVTMVGAMAAAGVVAGATGASMRSGHLGTRRLGTCGYLVAALSVFAIFFVYLPLLLFSIWIVVVSWNDRSH